jgi:hypothetical protein
MTKRAHTARDKYRLHKNDAAKRGIPFELPYRVWLQIWMASGHWKERGPLKGQYVMARHGDVGAYAFGNVKIVTTEENRAEQKLTEATRKKMRASGRIKVFTKTHRHAISMTNRGVGNAHAKLDDQKVLEIRATYVPGSRKFGYSALGRKHGVSAQTVWIAVNGQGWKHVPHPSRKAFEITA